MPKLLTSEKFIDVSDYGRKPAVFLAELVKNTKVQPIHITYLFGICGLIAIYCIFNELYYYAAAFLILKSILDAMDGELARLKQTPSYSGRYLDSIFDSILNFLFLLAIGYMAGSPLYVTLTAFFCIQLQGTLYNYYYVILRHRSQGADTTSKIFEMKTPAAFPGEKQKTVNWLFKIYMFLYIPFDKIIYSLDKSAYRVKAFPNWFMTMVSFYGLGFQLLIMAYMMAMGWITFIIPYFIAYTVLIVFFITTRRILLDND
ncbi:CDP-alcohol phosphatidyltransferase family protein [Marivirga sp. S37H4]|uniref:CDP-alcohol phosphatidyltransferase family protein n=1 Tax=Marivirga aurantiaca TaxID=2802615 RepID=A0A934WWN9_9BACT|nr:CDP-alcohol phosphatidyltransferase family protein [Marivirga aurantiaca]MBK6264473.1 CDP-alcohol phosphatidyltransferase family protein [Marivirga aurantiaca]